MLLKDIAWFILTLLSKSVVEKLKGNQIYNRLCRPPKIMLRNASLLFQTKHCYTQIQLRFKLNLLKTKKFFRESGFCNKGGPETISENLRPEGADYLRHCCQTFWYWPDKDWKLESYNEKKSRMPPWPISRDFRQVLTIPTWRPTYGKPMCLAEQSAVSRNILWYPYIMQSCETSTAGEKHQRVDVIEIFHMKRLCTIILDIIWCNR